VFHPDAYGILIDLTETFQSIGIRPRLRTWEKMRPRQVLKTPLRPYNHYLDDSPDHLMRVPD